MKILLSEEDFYATMTGRRTTEVKEACDGIKKEIKSKEQ